MRKDSLNRYDIPNQLKTTSQKKKNKPIVEREWENVSFDVSWISVLFNVTFVAKGGHG